MNKFIKKINHKLAFEITIVVLILSVLAAVMIPRFLENQELARIKLNEEELKKMLTAIQQTDNHYRQILLRHILSDPNIPHTGSLYDETNIAGLFPNNEFHFDLQETEKPFSIFLGLDYIPKIDELTKDMDYPIGIFIIMNDKKETISSPYFERIFIDNTFIYMKPNPKYYFAPSNGLTSSGMIYFDTLGRSWRD